MDRTMDRFVPSNSCVIKSKLLKKFCVVIIRFVPKPNITGGTIDF